VTEEDKGHTVSYLHKWITASRKAAKNHWHASRAAYAEFNKDGGKLSTSKEAFNISEGWYPIYHSSVKTVEAAYYARTPKLTTNRLWDNSDESIIRRSTYLERLGDNLLKYSHIDDAMRAAVQDFIHADKATVQLVYEGSAVESLERIGLEQRINDDGAAEYYEGDSSYPDEVFEDDEGYFYSKSASKIEGQKIYLSPLCYDEVLHSPEAKTEAEITIKAYKFSLTWDEVKQRFGEEKATKVKDFFKASNSYKSDDRDSDETPEAPGKFLEGWEVYCKKTYKVYWVNEDYKDDCLDIKDYMYDLEGVFPSPKFRISSKPPKSLYPTPEFVHLRNLLGQLHELQDKMFRGIKTIERKIIIDGAEKDLILALESAENVYVAAENFQSIVEKGGVAGILLDVPVREFVAALTEFTQLKTEFKNEFFEHFGVPDILRGISDAMETAAAQEIKQGAAYDRFRYNKKQLTDLARDAIEMMIDLALKVYDDQKIAQIVGGNILDAVFLEDLAFLRNDTERTIRIDIETDSTNFINEQAQVQQKTAVTTTLVQGMQQISAMLTNGQPEYAAVSLHALTSLLDSMPGGKAYVQEMKGYTQQLIEKAMQPPEATPPPPDYEGMKQQNAANKIQLDSQSKMRELDQREFKLQLDQQQQNFDQQITAQQAALNERVEQAYEMIEFTKLEMAKMSEQLEAVNKVEDNKRLENQQVLDTIAILQSKVDAPVKPTTPNITVNVGGAKKKVKVKRTAEGLEGESFDYEDIAPVII